MTGQVYHCEPNEENYTDTALIFVDMKNRWLLSAAVLFSAVCANPASALERGPQYHYDKGVELYERQQYGSALAEFKKALGAMSVDDAGYRMRARYYVPPNASRRAPAKCSNGLSRTIPIRST